MNMEQPGPGEEVMRSVARWWTITGIWALVAGSVAVVWPDATVWAMAILLGAYFVVGGAMLAATNIRDRASTQWRGARVVLGLVVAAAGALVWAWPGVTVWALAALIAVTFIVSGVGDIATSIVWRRVLPGWGWLFASGVIAVVAGLLVVTWPGITVFALAIVAGVSLISFGVIALVAATRVWRAADRLHDGGYARLRIDGIDVGVSDVMPHNP